MKQTTYIPGAGEHILKSATNAVALSEKHSKRVIFRFNGVLIRAKRNSVPQKLEAAYHDLLSRAYESWKQSSEGQRQLEREQIQRWENIKLARNVIDELPEVLASNNLDALMLWVQQFVPAQDWNYVSYDQAAIAQQLLDAGYVTSEHVGQAPEWFNNRERMGRYLIGQLLNGLLEGKALSPMCGVFALRYFQLAY